MALVQMKCPNCGGQMEMQGGNMAFRCPYCGTAIIDIVEAKLDSDVTIMSPQEFERKINENKKSLIVKIDENLEEVDVDATVINKKIRQAKEYLKGGRFYEVIEVFNDDLARSIERKWVDLPSVNRLLLLADCKAKDESELILRPVELEEYRYPNSYNAKLTYYGKILKSSIDQKTKDAYRIIARECKKNCEISKEIEEGYKLLKVGEIEKFIAYAKSMCNKYPYKIKSWVMLAEAYKDDLKGLKDIYEIIKYCPDFYLYEEEINEKIKGRINTIIREEREIIEKEKAEKAARLVARLKYTALSILGAMPLFIVLCIDLWLCIQGYCIGIDRDMSSWLAAFILVLIAIAFLVVTTVIKIILNDPDGDFSWVAFGLKFFIGIAAFICFILVVSFLP